jgi:enediyne biosynthesis protein E4
VILEHLRASRLAVVAWASGALAILGAAALAAQASPPGAAGTLRFREVALEWGLDFRHHHGGSGQRYMVETMVGGLMLVDYDGDGDLDVLFVDGGVLPGYEGEPARTRLFRNDSRPGAMAFVDVTERAGIDFTAYGCGAVAGDVDGDGDLDLYLTAWGPNALYLNQGDGTFVEAATEAGVADPSWSASAVFFDADRDGDLDLYVANYVDFSLANHKFCGDVSRGIQGYCHPNAYDGLPDRFYRNRGDGTFEDATAAAGLAGPREAGLGAVAADLDGDGWPDLYVANDLDPNLLFRNRGAGTFEDMSLLSGTSHSPAGRAEAGMGVEAADLDGDGRLDLYVTNFALETNAFYRNQGDFLFFDQRFGAKLAEPSLHVLGFGVAAQDFDHDGDLDLFVANGHILDNAEELSEVKQYAQRNQVMENLGDGTFRERLDAGVDVVRVSRGLATGDLDGDGDLDVVIVNSNQQAEVYENLGAAADAFLLVDLRASGKNTSGIGARLDLSAAGRSQAREVRTASSYLSQGAITVHFGLGAAARAELAVRWPGGGVRRYRELGAGRRLLVVQ